MPNFGVLGPKMTILGPKIGFSGFREILIISDQDFCQFFFQNISFFSFLLKTLVILSSCMSRGKSFHNLAPWNLIDIFPSSVWGRASLKCRLVLALVPWLWLIRSMKFSKSPGSLPFCHKWMNLMVSNLNKLSTDKKFMFLNAIWRSPEEWKFVTYLTAFWFKS